MKTTLTLGDHSHSIELMILQLSIPQIILGIPWLKKWNPAIDWPRLSMTIPSLPHLPIPYHARYLGLDVDHELSSLLAISSPPAEDDWSLHEYCLWTGGANEHINKITISTQLAQADKPKNISVPNFCSSFADVFSEQTYNILPPHCPFNHTIELKDSFVPKITKVYPLNPAEKEACKDFIDEQLKTERILPLKSPQASPFFFVPKKDGTLQPCQDYRYLNTHTIHNGYPLTLIPELINDMKDSTLFTKFDVRWGHNNIHIREEDQWKVAFITPFGLFEPTIMFFGFCNAPPMFQAFMDHIFADMIAKRWLKIYMDNLGIHTKDDLELHHQCTRHVLSRLQEHGLSLKISKCSFDTPTMEYLGMIIGQGLVPMDPTKLSAIKDWQPPSSVKGIHSFLGFANFYRKFIPNYSNIVAPIVLLTRKNLPWSWTEPQQNTFDTLKAIFSSAPVLCIPDVSRPFSLMTDASLLAAGAVLMQSDATGDLHPCTYFSKTFSLAERNYHIYDRELLAVILTLAEWKQYLQGTSHPVSVLTDHKNLSYLKDCRKLSQWQARWSLFLQDFDLVWKVTPGTHMGPADALSQQDHLDTTEDNVDTPILPDPMVINSLDLTLA